MSNQHPLIKVLCLAGMLLSLPMTGHAQNQDGLSLLAPANLNKPRPPAPFNVTGAWSWDSKFAGANFDPPDNIVLTPYGQGHHDAARKAAAEGKVYRNDIGLCWPRHVAPADVHLIATGKDDSAYAAAERLATELAEQGIEVLYDDRTGKVSPGVKFKDAELIGVPTIVTVGRSLAESGTIEIKDRRSGEREEVAADAVVDHLVRLVRA